jgi:RND family efflux transporter MFP subunit
MNAPEQRLLPLASTDLLWAQLQAADSRERQSALWLRWLQAMLPETAVAVVLLDDGQGQLAASAVLPEGHDGQALRAVVSQAVEMRTLSIRPIPAGHELALPLLQGGRACGAVGVSLPGADSARVWQAAATLRWGMGWLRGALAPAADPALAGQLARARLALDIALGALNHTGFRPAAMAVAGQLAAAFDCQTVQLGWLQGAGVRLVTRSNSAWHEGRADLVRLAEQAMDEAIDQGLALAVPAPEAAGLVARVAHEAYARANAGASLLSVPLRAHGVQVGALLFERPSPFTADDIEGAEVLAATLAPLLLLRHQGDESVVAHLRRTGSAWLAWAFGMRHAGWKLLGVAALSLLLLAALLPVTHRVSAPSLIEGRTQRAAVAPFAGFIQTAAARAGDTVSAGQVLATLDDRDLQLEQQRWAAELEVATRREREALAAADRVALRQAGAEAERARAQLDLVRAKLQRVSITAPFDGVVVKGDLTQRLGAPVELGEVLFELAPLEAWRVILKVDERDIAWVQPGQQGELVLAGLPGQRFELSTQRVLSVAEAEEGRNMFRVEAALAPGAARLRPGMEGVAKVEVGEVTLLWVWTHRLWHWLQRTAWEWSP